jgi:hypothetical protein
MKGISASVSILERTSLFETMHPILKEVATFMHLLAVDDIMCRMRIYWIS